MPDRPKAPGSRVNTPIYRVDPHVAVQRWGALCVGVVRGAQQVNTGGPLPRRVWPGRLGVARGVRDRRGAGRVAPQRIGLQQHGIASGLLVLTGLRYAADPLLLESGSAVCRRHHISLKGPLAIRCRAPLV